MMKFNPIPDDLDFWNHVLWVTRNPELIKRFMPRYLEIFKGKNNYFVMEHIPF